MRSEYSANKALFDTSLSLRTFHVAKKMAQAFNKKPEAKLSDMQSMKEFQAKSGIVGKAIYLID